MSFGEILGQERALKRLRLALESGRIPPALLFHGPEGIGKTKTALEFAKALNCVGQDRPCDQCASCLSAAKGIDPDLKRVNAAYQAGLREEEAQKQRFIRVETVRHLIKDLEMKSLGGRWKVAVLEDAERLVVEAANALLKALEEPPPRTLWILVTSAKDKMLPTVLSRCHRVTFSSLGRAALLGALESNGIPREEALSLAASAEGSAGAALALRNSPWPPPRSWMADPLAPFKLSEELPKELHLARPLAEQFLREAASSLREGAGHRRSLSRLSELRSALRSNASPGLVVQLAALELQKAG